MPARTPLHDRHVALGARIVDFAGYDMPLQYSGIRQEHTAVRERAGIFDVSHMGEVRLRGAGALEAVQALVANDSSRLEPGRALYGVMCREDGGIVDDVIVTRDPADDGYLVVVNAACRAKDVAWMRRHLPRSATLDDVSDDLALLAVQGPAALGIVQRLTGDDLSALHPFSVVAAPVAGLSAATSIISRTGYTGEDGVEIYIDAARAPALWDALLEEGRADGLVPAGLGARDTLRLEAGLRLYGQDMDETVDPLSAGLGWTVKLRGRDFIGAPALRRLRQGGPPRAMLGLALEGRAIARHGQPVHRGDEMVGEVTSGTFSLTLGHGIATALVDASAADATELLVDIRGTATPARVVPTPFYRRPSVAGVTRPG